MTNVSSNEGPRLSGDTPKRAIAQDEFGLDRIVDALATTLAGRIAADTYSLGVQGPWGSGKSSLAAFVAEKIKSVYPNHYTLHFDPWLIGQKTALLPAFLGQLAPVVDRAQWTTLSWGQRIDFWVARRFGRTLASKIRRYGEYAATLGTSIGGLAAGDASGTAAMAAVGLKSAGSLKKLLDASAQSLEKLKNSISSDLRALKAKQPDLRFTVIIDDSDRLEPAEAVEVLRLIRSAADFPLLTFVVCYDADILARQVETALQVPNGGDYIEKIFENILVIPPHEPFALRRHLRDLLSKDFPNEMSALSAASSDVGYRQHIVLDTWAGALITTPRDAVRLHEAVKFGWSNVPAGSDFLDFVWLQLIKLKSRELFKWTQVYLSNVGAYRDGGRAGDAEPSQQAQTLYAIMKEYSWHERSYLSGIDNILPGVQSFTGAEADRKVFEFQHDELTRYENQRRLGSPTHWRQYFAFDLPTYAISDELLASFRKALGQPPDTARAMLQEQAARPHTTPGHFIGVMFDRLADAGPASLSDDEIRGLLTVLADIMDDIVELTGEFEKKGRSDTWFKSTRLFDKRLGPHFEAAAKSGRALNWIAEIVRDQGFAHGLPEGSNQAEPGRQWLTTEELTRAVTAVVDRSKALGAAGVFVKPNPLDILFCWYQLSDKEGVRTFIAEAIAEDGAFLDALDAMRGWSLSNLGVRYPLPRSYVDMFIDAGAAKARLTALAADDTAPHETRSRAADLLRNWTENH